MADQVSYTEVKSFIGSNYHFSVKKAVEDATTQADEYITRLEEEGSIIKILATTSQVAIVADCEIVNYIITMVIEVSNTHDEE